MTTAFATFALIVLQLTSFGTTKVAILLPNFGTIDSCNSTLDFLVLNLFTELFYVPFAGFILFNVLSDFFRII